MSLTSSNGVVLGQNDRRLMAALSWLNLVDAEEYASSWKDSGSVFQSRIGCADWIETISVVRDPLGSILSRKIKKSSEHKSLPGVPDGDYAILLFDTVFEKKQESQESVTLAKSKKGWGVVGYFIR